MRQKILAIGMAVAAIFLLARFEPKYVTAPNYGQSLCVTGSSKDGIVVTITRLPNGRYDWQEYNYTVENQGTEKVENLKIRIPVYGGATAFQCWGMQAECEYGVITIQCSGPLKAGEKYECMNGEKFGYSGGGLPRTPKVIKE